MADDGRLDPFDPRFPAPQGSEADHVDRRSLVKSNGPGPSHGDPKVRVLRVAIPVLAIAGVAVVVAVFVSGLSPGGASAVVGPEALVRAAVAQRPFRYCFNDANPCAWLTIVEEEVVAFSTSGPMPEEYGRQGVGWCASSGYFGANATGSMWDQRGRVVRGPAPRSLDEFATDVDAAGNLIIRFGSLNAGLAHWQIDGDVSPPSGPLCEQIPFDRTPDLVLQP
ncbi:MAG TPA: hypothetical protein VMM13_11380 [Euzebya sp.]|nr:hypothetical protein [Euzebya sp.]